MFVEGKSETTGPIIKLFQLYEKPHSLSAIGYMV